MTKNASWPFVLASTNADSCCAVPEEMSARQPSECWHVPMLVRLVLVDVLDADLHGFFVDHLAAGVRSFDWHEWVGAVEEQPAAVGEVARLAQSLCRRLRCRAASSPGRSRPASEPSEPGFRD